MFAVIGSAVNGGVRSRRDVGTCGSEWAFRVEACGVTCRCLEPVGRSKKPEMRLTWR